MTDFTEEQYEELSNLLQNIDRWHFNQATLDQFKRLTVDRLNLNDPDDVHLDNMFELIVLLVPLVYNHLTYCVGD